MDEIMALCWSLGFCRQKAWTSHTCLTSIRKPIPKRIGMIMCHHARKDTVARQNSMRSESGTSPMILWDHQDVIETGSSHDAERRPQKRVALSGTNPQLARPCKATDRNRLVESTKGGPRARSPKTGPDRSLRRDAADLDGKLPWPSSRTRRFFVPERWRFGWERTSDRRNSGDPSPLVFVGVSCCFSCETH